VTQTIQIKNWDRFQHYKDRDPPWIKLYRDLLSAESWVLGTDSSRLVQIASTLLAARYQNATPLNFSLFRKVASIDLTAKEFNAAIAHLSATGFLEIQGDTSTGKQDASTPLASCASDARLKEAEAEAEAEQRVPTEPCPAERDRAAVDCVFNHWKLVHGHPKSKLDDKRRREIRAALANYTADELCEAIAGYSNSPHHMGSNDRSTRYDDIELFLRDAKHIDAGIQFGRESPQKFSKLTRENLERTTDWVPPEMRHAAQ
jgi:hypothetical protein